MSLIPWNSFDGCMALFQSNQFFFRMLLQKNALYPLYECAYIMTQDIYSALVFAMRWREGYMFFYIFTIIIP